MKINKKKFYLLVLIIFLIIVFIFSNIKSKRNYEIKYELNGYKVLEKYNKKEELYLINISIDNIEFPFVFNNKYTNSRKLIKNINEEKINGGICLTVELSKNKKSLCYKDEKLVSKDTLEENSFKVLKTKSNIKIYNDKHDYYIWNGFGYTDVLTNKKYNIIKNETYNNNLTYQVNNYIISPNYDQSRRFNKFIIFNMITKKISKIEVENISYDMYYLGYVDSNLYIFDRDSSIEYKIELNKNKISKVNNADAGIIYDKGLTYIDINKLKYQDIEFTYDYLYNHEIIDNKLYIRLPKKLLNKDIMVQISKNDIKDILRRDENNIYYISNDNLYVYSIDKSEQLLLNYFEWNFNYRNKIFVY